MPPLTPIIPENITVHLGTPSSDAPNVTVPFSDYIKNVASSEIYPTWPESALRANILAQISFALNRIYTEYYRSRGYNFNITNSPAFDQAYVEGRNIFESISVIVDDIFDSYLRRQGFIEPLFAEYCNGTTVTCDGLSQWGTVDLAENGENSVDIVRHYYGDDVEIVFGAPVAPLQSSPPIRVLRLGSTGNDVFLIQTRLNRISNNFPSIPKIPDINGYFDIETDTAVREFQAIFDLPVDGAVGKATWYKIQQIFSGVKKLNELTSEGLSYEEIPLNLPESISAGDEGVGVISVQYLLKYVAEYENTVPSPETSGVYDAATEESIKAFQRTYGLPETGITDERTYARLFDVYNAIILSLPPSQFIGTVRPYPGYILSDGFEGEYVRYLQEYLNAIASVFVQVEPVTVDGIFGIETENAVKAVQELAGIPITGRVNTVTWEVIGELYSGIYSGQISSPDQFPGYIID